MTKAIITPAAVDPVVDMGLRIGALIEQALRLEEAKCSARRLHGEEAADTFERAEDAAWREANAAEDYAITMPCRTLAGAAVQLLLAYNRCNLAEGRTGDADAVRYITQAATVIRGCMKVVAAAAGFDLNRAGGDYFAGEHTDPHPDFDLVAAE